MGPGSWKRTPPSFIWRFQNIGCLAIGVGLGPISWPKPKWRRFWSPTHVSDRAQPIITSYNHHSGACNEIEMQSEVDRTQVSKRVFFSSVCFIGCFIELLLRSFDFSLRCKEGILGGGCARLRFWHGRSRCCPRISI